MQFNGMLPQQITLQPGFNQPMGMQLSGMQFGQPQVYMQPQVI